MHLEEQRVANGVSQLIEFPDDKRGFCRPRATDKAKLGSNTDGKHL